MNIINIILHYIKTSGVVDRKNKILKYGIIPSVRNEIDEKNKS
jgi:hypothetical protein